MNGEMKMVSQRGFTLIELLVIVSIIGLLAMLGITSFGVYRSDAAYSVASRTLRDARTTVEASLNNIDTARLAVNFYQQGHPGPIADAAAAALMPGMMIPRNIKLTASHDPDCDHAGCQAEFLQVNHCLGKKYIAWSRFGDGLEFMQEHIEGVGCP